MRHALALVNALLWAVILLLCGLPLELVPVMGMLAYASTTLLLNMVRKRL